MKLEEPQLDIGLVTADASKARSFYGEILGYPEEEPRSFCGDAVQYRFRAGAQLLKLMDLPQKPESHPTGIYDRIGYRVLAVFVDDLTALREKIHESGRSTTDPKVIVGENRTVMRLCERALDEGVYAQGIRFPSVPKGTARIRFTPTCAHKPEDVDKVVEVFAALR